MQETNDLEELVNRYLDLWQEQWSLMATDPALASAVTRYMEIFGHLPDLVTQQALQKQGELYHRVQETSSIGTESTQRTATNGPASDARRAKLDELLERVASLEKRLAELASETGG